LGRGVRRRIRVYEHSHRDGLGTNSRSNSSCLDAS
jgi:hypothetical protein